MLTQPRPAVAAAAWAALFALPSFFWATGANFGADTIAADPKSAFGAGAQPWALVVAGLLKLVVALFALSYLVRRLPVSFRLRFIASVIVSVGLLSYGLANLVGHVLMLAGVSGISPDIGEYAVRWHTFFWDPVWIMGGALYAFNAKAFRSKAQG